MKNRALLHLTMILGGLAPAMPAIARSDPVIERATPAVPGTIEIGSRKQLFLDDLIIEQTSRISRFMGRPQKYAKNPVIVPDQPWELEEKSDTGSDGVQITGQNVLYDAEEKIFKMWYWATSDNSEDPLTRRRPGYAISRDGYHWEKPNLDLCEYQGNRNNNLISPRLWGGGGYHNIFKDSRDADPQRRYKAIGWGNNHGDRKYADGKTGMTVAFSPDGLRWTEYAGNPVVPRGWQIADSPTLLGWDPRIQKYVYYPRPGQPMGPVFYSEGTNRRTMRTIGYSESDDFIHWTPTRLMLAPDDQDRVDYQYYQITTALYGDFYIGLMAMYETHEKTFNVFLMSSRDGFDWNWIDRRVPFLGRGEIGSYDAGYMTPSGPIFHDNKVWIFYGAYSGTHSFNALDSRYGFNHLTIALATLPMDRFLGLMAGPFQALVVTRPVRFSGKRLLLDFDSDLPELSAKVLASMKRDPTKNEEQADVRAAIEDLTGGRIDGFALEQCRPLTGSGVQEMVWPGADWSRIAGKPVRVRLAMRHATLYSLQFSE